jgi:hypothetical protein
VVANQIVGRAGDFDSVLQEAHLQFAQVLFSTAIGEGDQRLDRYTTLYRIFERFLDLQPVKAEDHDLHALLCVFDGLYQRTNTVSRLYQQFQIVAISRAYALLSL